MIGQHRHKTCTSVCFTFFYGRLSRLHSVLLIPPGSLFYVESRIVSIFLKSWHQAVQSRWGGQGVRHCVPTVYRVSRKPLLCAPWHHWTCTSFVILVSIWNVSAAILCFLVSPCKIWFLACSAHLLCQRLLLCSFVLLLWIFVHPIKLVKVLLLFLIVSAFGSTPTYWTLGPPDTVAEMLLQLLRGPFLLGLSVPYSCHRVPQANRFFLQLDSSLFLWHPASGSGVTTTAGISQHMATAPHSSLTMEVWNMVHKTLWTFTPECCLIHKALNPFGLSCEWQAHRRLPSWAPWVRPHHKPHSGKQPAPRPGSKVGPW